MWSPGSPVLRSCRLGRRCFYAIVDSLNGLHWWPPILLAVSMYPHRRSRIQENRSAATASVYVHVHAKFTDSLHDMHDVAAGVCYEEFTYNYKWFYELMWRSPRLQLQYMQFNFRVEPQASGRNTSRSSTLTCPCQFGFASQNTSLVVILKIIHSYLPDLLFCLPG